jgi:hypothetical protein
LQGVHLPQDDVLCVSDLYALGDQGGALRFLQYVMLGEYVQQYGFLGLFLGDEQGYERRRSERLGYGMGFQELYVGVDGLGLKMDGFVQQCATQLLRLRHDLRTPHDQNRDDLQ